MCCLPLSFDIFYTLKNMSKTQSEHNIILTYDLIKIMISNFLGGISQMLPENLVHKFLIGANVHPANPHQAFFQFFPRNFAPCSPVPETHPHPAVDTLSLSTAHLGSIAVSWTGGHLGGAGALGRPGALSGEGGGGLPPRCRWCWGPKCPCLRENWPGQPGQRKPGRGGCYGQAPCSAGHPLQNCGCRKVEKHWQSVLAGERSVFIEKSHLRHCLAFFSRIKVSLKTVKSFQNFWQKPVFFFTQEVPCVCRLDAKKTMPVVKKKVPLPSPP